MSVKEGHAMAAAREIQRLQRDLTSATRVINDLVRENYELREQVVLLVVRNQHEPQRQVQTTQTSRS